MTYATRPARTTAATTIHEAAAPAFSEFGFPVRDAVALVDGTSEVKIGMAELDALQALNMPIAPGLPHSLVTVYDTFEEMATQSLGGKRIWKPGLLHPVFS